MGTVIFWIIFWIVIAVLAFCPLYFIFLFIVGLFVDMNKEYERDSKFYRFLLTNSTAVAAKLIRIRVKVTGRELLPKDTRYLLVCNHRSKFEARELQGARLRQDNPPLPVHGDRPRESAQRHENRQPRRRSAQA